MNLITKKEKKMMVAIDRGDARCIQFLAEDEAGLQREMYEIDSSASLSDFDVYSATDRLAEFVERHGGYLVPWRLNYYGIADLADIEPSDKEG
jgi:hypothetical protein